jgi:hypothetical protein
LPYDHPLAPLLRTAPDFADKAGLADALLHPSDRAYSVPECRAFLERAGLSFLRWVRQAPYLAQCGALASTPHAARLAALPAADQFAAIELFRGTMVRHAMIAGRSDELPRASVDFDGGAWPQYVPLRLPDTVVVRDKAPPGAAAVLINRNHRFADLYLPVDAARLRLLEQVDGTRSIEELCADPGDRDLARDFFRQLWRWDQIVVRIP